MEFKNSIPIFCLTGVGRFSPPELELLLPFVALEETNG